MSLINSGAKGARSLLLPCLLLHNAMGSNHFRRSIPILVYLFFIEFKSNKLCSKQNIFSASFTLKNISRHQGDASESGCYLLSTNLFYYSVKKSYLSIIINLDCSFINDFMQLFHVRCPIIYYHQLFHIDPSTKDSITNYLH